MVPCHAVWPEIRGDGEAEEVLQYDSRLPAPGFRNDATRRRSPGGTEEQNPTQKNDHKHC